MPRACTRTSPPHIQHRPCHHILPGRGTHRDPRPGQDSPLPPWLCPRRPPLRPGVPAPPMGALVRRKQTSTRTSRCPGHAQKHGRTAREPGCQAGAAGRRRDHSPKPPGCGRARGLAGAGRPCGLGATAGTVMQGDPLPSPRQRRVSRRRRSCQGPAVAARWPAATLDRPFASRGMAPMREREHPARHQPAARMAQ